MSSIGSYSTNVRLPGGDVNSVMLTYGTLDAQKIQNLSADIVSAKFLFVDKDGTIKLDAQIMSDLKMASSARLLLDKGSLVKPSLSFVADTTSGLFYSTDAVNTVVAGNLVTTTTPTSLNIFDTVNVNNISTVSGDLSLNPTGPNIDFNGKNLMNIGTITVNPYVYTVISPPNIISVSVTPFTVLSIGNLNNQSQLIKLYILGANTTTSQTYAYDATIKLKNISNVISYVVYGITTSREPSFNGTGVSYTVTGSNINVVITPANNNTIKWIAKADVIAQSF